MNILIYYAQNARAVDQQSQALLFKKMGHNPILLTWLPEGDLHRNFKKNGFEAYSAEHVKGRSVVFFIRQAIYLARFCEEHKIDVIFSHLQNSAIVTGIARFFIKSKVVYVRHHSDYVGIYNSKKERVQNWFANKYSPKIIAISEGVKQQLIKEGVNEKKIVRINLCYDFKEYIGDTAGDYESIKSKIASDLTILYVARLDPVKRHKEAFKVVEGLLSKGINCKLICIGAGNIEVALRQYIADHNLGANVFLLGFVTNVFDYIKASDILMLISDTEASSHMLKEAGLNKKTIIVCESVGDFSDYIVHRENGFLVNRENPVPETIAILEKMAVDKVHLKEMGEKLNATINHHFSIEGNFDELYSRLFKDLKVG